MKGILTRYLFSEIQTIGRLNVFSDDGKMVFDCYTLEPPWRSNIVNISSINPGRWYDCKKYESPSNGTCYLLEDVDGRTWIEIHALNFNRNTTGCIGVGSSLMDIDLDGAIDIGKSKETMRKLIDMVGEKLKLYIVEVK